MAAGAGVDRNAASPGFDGASDAFARAHDALMRGKDLQFEPTAAPKPPNVPDWFEPAVYRTPVYARFTNKRWLFFFRSRYQTEFLWVDDTGTNAYYFRDITL